MKHTYARLGAVMLIAASTALATACSSPADPGSNPGSTVAPTSAPSTVPSSAGSPSPDAEPEPVGDPTCETIIPEATAADFAEVGWTVREDPLVIGATEIADGLQCTWGDYSVASDHVQVFGWAPISEDDAEAAQQELRDAGWKREEGDLGVYVTEDPKTALGLDDDGYGLTYLFGDGWVKFADTKQSLLLVVWPPVNP